MNMHFIPDTPIHCDVDPATGLARLAFVGGLHQSGVPVLSMHVSVLLPPEVAKSLLLNLQTLELVLRQAIEQAETQQPLQ